MNNMYEFKIDFGSVFGGMSIAAKSEEEAQEKMMDIVSERLADAFPELDIEYSVECEAIWEGGDPDEKYEAGIERELSFGM